MMVVLGIDAHKRNHTVVAVDAGGAHIAEVTVPATDSGHRQAIRFAAAFPQRRWAIEDCRHLSRRFESVLLAAGEAIVRVPPKMMAQSRRSARTSGKSDPIDAVSIARAALQEPDLPPARLAGVERDIKLLADYRESLVRQRVKLENRLRWRLHELVPDYDPAPNGLHRYKTLDTINQLLADQNGVVADLALRETSKIRDLTVEIKQLEDDIAVHVEQVAPHLVELPGCGYLTAAKLIGETANIDRFKSKDAYAMWAGIAPIPVWSGNQQRFRLNRGGNRQANTAIHRIAITQSRYHPPAQEFINRRITAGNTKREAIRALKRRLADVIYKTLKQANQPQTTHHPLAA